MSKQITPYPALAELPPPPPGRTGWPWDGGVPAQPKPAIPGWLWPKLTVITPSFNQGKFIEETIRSVLLQGYPNLEYIIIDGGSTDASVEIIRKYTRWLTFWCTEKDRGQVDAINKGLQRATGDFFNWINSDDFIPSGALHRIALATDGGCDLVAGTCVNFDSEGNQEPIVNASLSARGLIRGGATFQQPALWWRRKGIQRCGGIKEKYDLAFDYDLLIRFLALNPKVKYLPDVLACFRLHKSSKTCSQSDSYAPERLRILADLAENKDFRGLRVHCSYRLRQFAWWDELRSLTEGTRCHGLRSASSILLEALKDPRVRLNRLTLGAIRRTLAG